MCYLFNYYNDLIIIQNVTILLKLSRRNQKTWTTKYFFVNPDNMIVLLVIKHNKRNLILRFIESISVIRFIKNLGKNDNFHFFSR